MWCLCLRVTVYTGNINCVLINFTCEILKPQKQVNGFLSVLEKLSHFSVFVFLVINSSSSSSSSSSLNAIPSSVSVTCSTRVKKCERFHLYLCECAQILEKAHYQNLLQYTRCLNSNEQRRKPSYRTVGHFIKGWQFE